MIFKTFCAFQTDFKENQRRKFEKEIAKFYTVEKVKD